MRVLPRLFKFSPWVDLDLFYAEAKFGYIGFAWAKVKITYHLETTSAIGLKVGLNIQIDELMKLNEYQRSRPLFDLGQRALRFQN